MARIKSNRSQAIKLRFKAKPGDTRIMDLMAQIKKDEMELVKIKERTSEQAFGSRNDEESVNNQIDLHGQTKVFALKVVNQRICQTSDDLIAGLINPNVGNGRDHIFKIICGAGKHSQGKAVLKPAVHDWLQAKDYEHYADLQNGVFLVRLSKY